jgi:hypothetical protein
LFFDMTVFGDRQDRRSLHASCPTLKGEAARCRLAGSHMPCTTPAMTACKQHYLRRPWPCACCGLKQTRCSFATHAGTCAPGLFVQPTGTKWTATKWIHSKPIMGNFDALARAGACQDTAHDCSRKVGFTRCSTFRACQLQHEVHASRLMWQS